MKKKGVQKSLAVVLCAAILSGNGHMISFAEQVSKENTETTAIQMTEMLEENLELPTGGVELPIAEKEPVTEEAEENTEFLWQQQMEYECAEQSVNGEYTNDYGYLSLETTGAQECYNLIKSAACTFHENFLETTERTSQSGAVNYIWNTVNIAEYELERDDFRKVLFAVEADYPEFFWFNGDFSYNTTSVDGKEVVKTAYLRVEEEYAEAEERKNTQQAIEDGMKPYLEAIDKAKASGADDMAIELLVHDMIIDAVEYAYVEGTTTPEDAAYAHSIVGVFNRLGVVCEGYSKAFLMLLNYADIECIYAIGYGNGGGHAWNQVCLDGEWYNIDLTWNDITEEKHDGVQYSFYNCSTESFGNHVYVPSVFPGMYGVPDTTADKYNYYKYYGLYVTSEVVEDEESFLEYMKKVTEESISRKDYLLQFGFDSSTTQSAFREFLRLNKSSIEERCSNSESIYKSKGTVSSVTNQWYSVFFPMVRIYADTYQADYNPQGAELEFHVVDGRNEISKENNYTVDYTDNTGVGTAKAAVTGIGDYEYLGTSEFEFTISGNGEITLTPINTPEPTDTIIPTSTIVPTNTITPTESATVTPANTSVPEPTVTSVSTPTPEPTATPVPVGEEIILHYKSTEGEAELLYREGSSSGTAEWIRVSMEPEGDGWYTYTLQNKESVKLIFDTRGEQTDELFIPSGEWWYFEGWYEYNPDSAGEITGIVTPTVTAIPTKIPTNTITPAITNSLTVTPTEIPVPTATCVPEKTEAPTATSIPSATPTPTPVYTRAPIITPVPSVTDTPKNSVTPEITKAPVKPGKITGLKLKSANVSSVKVTFEKKDNAAGYCLVLCKGNEEIKRVETTAAAYTFKNLSPATIYTVKVCGYSEKGNEASHGNYSKVLKVATATKAPAIKSITAGKNSAVISWKKVKGATGYEIYMAAGKNSTYKKVAALKQASVTKYTKKKLVSGKTYYFKIRTYKTVGGTKIYSSYSKKKSVKL